MSDFEKLVRKALIDKEMSMKELAEAMNVSVSYVHDILKGKRNAETVRTKIIQFLDIAYE